MPSEVIKVLPKYYTIIANFFKPSMVTKFIINFCKHLKPSIVTKLLIKICKHFTLVPRR